MYINICPLGTAGKTKCDSGVVGNARPCQGRDRGFESRLSLSKNQHKQRLPGHSGAVVFLPLKKFRQKN